MANLANALSVSRVALAGALWIAPTRPAWLIAVAVVAAATDVGDGFFARLSRARRVRRGGPLWVASDDVGAWLDPLCDKIFIVSLVVAAWVCVAAPPLHLALIASRELLLLPLIAAYLLLFRGRRRWARLDFRARWPGKLTTVAQFAALLAVALRHPAGPVFVVLAAALGVLAVASYAVHALRSTAAHSH